MTQTFVRPVTTTPFVWFVFVGRNRRVTVNSKVTLLRRRCLYKLKQLAKAVFSKRVALSTQRKQQWENCSFLQSCSSEWRFSAYCPSNRSSFSWPGQWWLLPCYWVLSEHSSMSMRTGFAAYTMRVSSLGGQWCALSDRAGYMILCCFMRKAQSPTVQLPAHWAGVLISAMAVVFCSAPRTNNFLH